MTLMLALAAKWRCALSADFRYSFRDSAPRDHSTQKVIPVIRFDWSALVGFTGVAITGQGVDISSWMAGAADRVAPRDSFDRLLEELSQVPTRLPHTFSVVAMHGRKNDALVAVVSNFEKLGADPRPQPSASFEVSLAPARRPRLFCFGSGAGHVDVEQHEALLRALADSGSARALQEEMARINEEVSLVDASVSPGCFTMEMRRDGKCYGMPHSIDPVRPYLPAFAAGSLPATFVPATDEDGNELPIQLRHVYAARASGEADITQLKVNLTDGATIEVGNVLLASVTAETTWPLRNTMAQVFELANVDIADV